MATTGAMVSVPLLLLLVLRATAGVAADADPWCVPRDDLEIQFDLFVTGNDYTQIEEVYNRVVGLSIYNAYGKPVMAQQTGERQPPPKWLLVVARGRGADVTKLAIRQDNLYLAGFTDSSGTWYTFANKAQLNLIPGATALDFGDNYAGLVGYGGWRSLRDLKVGRESTLRAISTMSNYVYSPQADQGCLARAVAVLVLTVCEANRLQPIFNAIQANWQTGGFLGYPVYRYVVNWKTISCALMVATQHGNQWDSRKDEAYVLNTELNIGSLPAAADSVFLLLWPDNEMCSEKINWLK